MAPFVVNSENVVLKKTLERARSGLSERGGPQASQLQSELDAFLDEQKILIREAWRLKWQKRQKETAAIKKKIRCINEAKEQVRRKIRVHLDEIAAFFRGEGEVLALVIPEVLARMETEVCQSLDDSSALPTLSLRDGEISHL